MRKNHLLWRAGLCALMLNSAGIAIAAGPQQNGEHIYRKVCSSCHGPGDVEAPELGDRAAWAPLIAEGQHVVTAHGWVGVREMPPRGGDATLTLEAFGRAVAYMARAAGADWRDPDGDPALMVRIRDEERARVAVLAAEARKEAADAGRSGKDVYASVCMHCHGTGVAGAPRLGDREAWHELIDEGQHIVTAHGWVGIRAMPPRGGHADLSLEEFGRAVAYMANSAGGQWPDPSMDAQLMGRIRVEEADRRQALRVD
ncbi:MAG: cytochrome c5 family protein [Betaproteobacteria bacterium HGW-Betaproteobacteria-21]|nr:MAG: cytochrome c5 family protein [Betaproteobacteria bacterium HGW-Betaproteobacteria-21]